MLSRRLVARALARLAPTVMLLVGCAGAAGTREPFPISSDRPSVSATHALVPQGRVLLESGAVVGEVNDEPFRQAGEVVVRAGVTGRLELDIGLPSYREVERRVAPGSGFAEESSGYSDGLIALRVAVLDAPAEGGPTPAVALLAATSIPTRGDFGSGGAFPRATLIANWALPHGLGFATNVGMAAIEGSNAQPRATGVLSTALGARLGVFAEAALARSDAGWGKTLVVFGATYLLTSRVQLDLAHRRRGTAREYRDVGIGLSVAR